MGVWLYKERWSVGGVVPLRLTTRLCKFPVKYNQRLCSCLWVVFVPEALRAGLVLLGWGWDVWWRMIVVNGFTFR
ncbi:hypothetical protein BO94DRAFT_352675 [Aspergillus sclerotioniger CBS 115572]|uniref:Uncharacterized protein n=1 Tax=Aspergillus sclerotioniger CBS 115572 TaxID=1450535 RepID=A0A317X824_9EURO|nr:hypothetical protein BO94DRAFT_352675 [Aspergillus sclerotioniger CBS 115572]PWY93792.1 hypothetical protein BO94DRAFT_352675 [Aspergillus sclerotioniger CBS 115572]